MVVGRVTCLSHVGLVFFLSFFVFLFWVCLQVNVTHAALDVVLRALRDYKNFGSGGGSGSTGNGTKKAESRVVTDAAGSGDGGGGGDGDGGSGGGGVKSSLSDVGGGGVAAAPALAAAASEATDGGGGGAQTLAVTAQQQQQRQQPQQQQRYSPFVLQNRTGLKLEFWAHQDKVERCAHPCACWT